MTARSSRADVRNPMVALPEVRELAELPLEARLALRRALMAFSSSCRVRGNEAWAKHKAPMAAYWKANAVNIRHLALSIPKT